MKMISRENIHTIKIIASHKKLENYIFLFLLYIEKILKGKVEI
jgi:hypothetical protein